MKKLMLLALMVLLTGCIWGRYPRHMDVENNDGGGGGRHHDGGPGFEGHGHDERH